MSFCTIICTDQKLVSLNSNALQRLVQIREEHFAAGKLPESLCEMVWPSDNTGFS